MKRPGLTDGMRHVALFVEQFSECEQFYTDLLGMEVEWRPDEDNVYLTSGRDNLALHRAVDRHGAQRNQPLPALVLVDQPGWQRAAPDVYDSPG